MKWLALLFIVVLTKGLNSHQNPEESGKNQNQHDHEKISILKVSPTFLVAEWAEGAEILPPPAVEHGVCGGMKFHEAYSRATADWGREIMDVVYAQGLAVGQNLINDVEDRYNDLVNSIDQSSKQDSERNDTEKNLEHLVNELQTFFTLKPGNQTIEHKLPLKVPEQPTKIISRTENHTASDFFLHFSEFITEDMSTAYGYIAGVFLKGWHENSKYFDIQQLQYRNQILNNWVLPAYRKVVEKVFKNRDYIKNCVTKDTWRSFENSGNSIIKISNEWLQTLVELKQDENSSYQTTLTQNDSSN